MDDYLVRLDTFRGPLDLLLYLVKRNEVDICDIPIAHITDEYRHYLDLLQMIDVESAGEFVVMLGTLIEIKSKMVLPRSEEETAEEADDPRLELVRQLIEYKKFKDAATLLEGHAEKQSLRMIRQAPAPPGPPDPLHQPLQAVELWDLVSAFGRLLRETLSLQPQQIQVDHTPIHVYMEQILTRLQAENPLPFRDLFTPPHLRGRLIGLFLAMLELMKGRRLLVQQPDPFAEIQLTLAPDASAETPTAPDTTAP